jgi:cyclophilin family peptidyl-prolyl cis-trans isomerase
MVIDTDNQYRATISTNKGDITVTLYDDVVPVAVNNFVVLANLGFYDNTPIALVQPDDSIVFGALDTNQRLSDAGYRFAAEVGAPIDTDIGALTYIPFAQTPEGDILSSSSQILIALIKPPAELNERFSFFGQVSEGEELLSQLTTEDTIESVVITVTE